MPIVTPMLDPERASRTSGSASKSLTFAMLLDFKSSTTLAGGNGWEALVLQFTPIAPASEPIEGMAKRRTKRVRYGDIFTIKGGFFIDNFVERMDFYKNWWKHKRVMSDWLVLWVSVWTRVRCSRCTTVQVLATVFKRILHLDFVFSFQKIKFTINFSLKKNSFY